jgi:hypothetical protein
MKRISTLFLVLFALLSLPLTASAEEVVFDFENNNGNWPVGNYNGSAFNAGDLTEPITMGEVTMTGINGNQPCRIMAANDNVIALYVYANASSVGGLKFNAAEGRALTKIEVTMKTGNFDFTASTGTLNATSWTGNATEVTFTRTGTGNRQMLKIVVTTADKNSETVEPAAPDFDLEATDIAAFRAAEDGKKVKLSLNKAQVNAIDDIFNLAYLEDASGAVEVTGITLTAGTVLDGYVIGTKSSTALDFADPDAGSEIKLAATDAQTFVATTASLSATSIEVAAIANAENHGRLMVINDIEIKKEGRFYYAYSGEDKVQVKDAFMVLPTDYEWPANAKSITGLVTFNGARWQIAPLKAADIVAAGTQSVAEFDFLDNNMELPIGSSDNINAGNLGGKSVTLGDVTLNFVHSSTMPTRYYFNAGKNQLQVIAGGQIRFTAAEGKAIAKIEITPVAATNNKWGVDGEVGTLSEDKLVWEGNTTTVRFTATGALYLTKIVVTTIAKDDATVTPADNDTYTEVASLAEFNALAKGTLAKLNLTNAVITSGMVNGWGYYVQDATAGAHFYCTGLDFEVNDAINGYIFVKKDFNQPGPRIAMTEKTNADNLEVTHNGTYTPVEGTFAEVVTAAHNNMVIKLSDVAVKGSAEADATITAGDQTLAISNGKSNYAPYIYQEALTNIDYASATVVGILWTNTAGTTFKLYPMSITEGSSDGIQNINAANAYNMAIYNLQGVRMNGLQKGINIVNGKKIVIK